MRQPYNLSNNRHISWFCILMLALGWTSCQPDEETVPPYVPALMEIPNGFDEIIFPEGNAFTKERWELGKKLFFDPVMSVDSSISCASCHLPSLAFSDDKAFSDGVMQQEGTRNSPTLANVAYHPYLTREGGVPTLEMQILIPIQEHNEFNFNIVYIAERLAADPVYTEMALTAYDRQPDAFVITRALSTFERSLISGYSPYDQYLQYDKPDAMTAAAIRGMDLFFSEKTKCATCHGGFNFTNYSFENNGLYESYEDPGRFRVTGEEADRAVFKVPSLRNIALTAPYMHNGSIATLDEVIEHYQTGGATHPNKSDLVRPFQLSNTEKEDLISFLQSLTDETFVNNSLFSE